MKNKLLLFTVLLFAFTFVQAQYSVLLVDDDANGIDESEFIETALTNSGFSFNVLNIDTNASPDFNTLNQYDMVIWTTANDGANLNLWDTSATVQFNAALRQFIDSNGVFWLDGLDYMYDMYGSAPDVFTAGDFVYDVMGISSYFAQAHADDSLGNYVGLQSAARSASNTITTADSIKWKWNEVWYADAFELTSDAVSLFEMGPASYDFAGKSCGLYRGNVISTSLRIGSLGDGSVLVQANIDLLVKEMIEAAELGTFSRIIESINTVETVADVSLYPNPSSDIVTLKFNAAYNASITIFDITGKVLLNDVIKDNSTSYKFDVSELNSGMYFYQMTINNSTISNKFSVVK